MGNTILYSLMFGLILSWLLQRGFRPGSKIRKLNIRPFCGARFDLLENISIVILLSVFPAKPVMLAWAAALCTLMKMAFLGTSVLFIFIGLVRAAMNGFGKK